MDETLLLQLAGFLTMIADGHIPTTDAARAESRELLDKLGAQIESSGG